MNDVTITLTLSSLFVQMLLKLAESTTVTVALMYCMKVVRNFRRRISAGNERTSVSEVTLLLTNKQRKLINEATSDRSTLQALAEGKSRVNPGGPSITIELTNRQRRQIKETTGQNPSRLKVTVVESNRKHEWVRAVFDRSGWRTALQEESAMSVSQFVERWASTLLFIVYLGAKMYLNVMHWIFKA